MKCFAKRFVERSDVALNPPFGQRRNEYVQLAAEQSKRTEAENQENDDGTDDVGVRNHAIQRLKKPETSFDDRCDRNAASAQIEEREENAVC